MTDEELDEARALEAMRTSTAANITGRAVATIAARLARENWQPPPKVDAEAPGMNDETGDTHG